MGRGNWKCPVCESTPKNAVKVTAGQKALKFKNAVVIEAKQKKAVCKEHVKELHI